MGCNKSKIKKIHLSPENGGTQPMDTISGKMENGNGVIANGSGRASAMSRVFSPHEKEDDMGSEE